MGMGGFEMLPGVGRWGGARRGVVHRGGRIREYYSVEPRPGEREF